MHIHVDAELKAKAAVEAARLGISVAALVEKGLRLALGGGVIAVGDSRLEQIERRLTAIEEEMKDASKLKEQYHDTKVVYDDGTSG